MERKVKRIGRVAKGETVVVNMITEDLQCQWDRIHELGEEGKRAIEEWMEDRKNMEMAKKALTLKHQFDKDCADFWMAINGQYNLWLDEVGIRDNYAIVKLPRKKGMKSVMGGPPSFEEFLRWALGGTIGGGIRQDDEEKDPFDGFPTYE